MEYAELHSTDIIFNPFSTYTQYFFARSTSSRFDNNPNSRLISQANMLDMIIYYSEK